MRYHLVNPRVLKMLEFEPLGQKIQGFPSYNLHVEPIKQAKELLVQFGHKNAPFLQHYGSNWFLDPIPINPI